MICFQQGTLRNETYWKWELKIFWKFASKCLLRCRNRLDAARESRSSTTLDLECLPSLLNFWHIATFSSFFVRSFAHIEVLKSIVNVMVSVFRGVNQFQTTDSTDSVSAQQRRSLVTAGADAAVESSVGCVDCRAGPVPALARPRGARNSHLPSTLWKLLHKYPWYTRVGRMEKISWVLLITQAGSGLILLTLPDGRQKVSAWATD